MAVDHQPEAVNPGTADPKSVDPGSLGPLTLEGRFVRLEPLRMEHAAGLLAPASNPELWRWFPTDLADPAEMRKWVGAAVEAERAGAEYAFCVISRDSGEPIGSTRFLDVDSANRSVEIGWTWYGRSAWGSRVNPESKLLLLAHAFETWRAHRVYLKTDSLNERSRAAIEGIGGKFEGILRKHRIRRDGTFRDSAYYSILDDEWPLSKALLERRLT